ncbi:MAG: hypothetical protein IPN39_13425 [Chitinophagaceae bacterium]|nr:hypothetical protein [Chitinophagaceae bacterium]
MGAGFVFMDGQQLAVQVFFFSTVVGFTTAVGLTGFFLVTVVVTGFGTVASLNITVFSNELMTCLVSL